MQEYSAPVDLTSISEKDIVRASNLMTRSAQIHADEDHRLVRISPDLAHFLDIQFKGTSVSEVRHCVPDGHQKVACPMSKSGERGALSPTILVFELKNGVGDGRADPVEEAQQCCFLLCTSPEASAYTWLNDGPSDPIYR